MLEDNAQSCFRFFRRVALSVNRLPVPKWLRQFHFNGSS